ncbi:hypothetical protein GCD22_01479 [Acidithiobacillus thiooxidans ATCC 19377]|uniref:Uncharacterized protein n=1 Tax=Acidithiobacillus thiooxidans ATCC 19377 TaxID=637390 RepID=A0A5P9XQG3_ACITH|nr:hypothetical protein GCD22_01479 [Acidithiobacillus thiooxidans ATCC 19377]
MEQSADLGIINVNQRYWLTTRQRQDFTALCRERLLYNSSNNNKKCQNIDLVLDEQY